MKIFLAINQSRVLYDFKRELVDALLARGDELYLSYEEDFRASYFASSEATVLPTPIDPRGLSPRRDAALYFFYRRQLKKLKPDLALTFTIKPNVYCGRACRVLGVPYLATISGLGAAVNAGGLLSRVSTALYRVGLRGASRVVCQNASIAKRLVDEKLARESQLMRVNGSGVDLDRFQPLPYPEEDAPVKLLFIGRLMRDKGVFEFLECARRFQEKKDAPKVQFQILGAPERGCDAWRAVGEASRAGMVEYLGYQLDVRPYVQTSSAVVLPSYHEGLSNVLLEGAASARPLVTSNVPGCLETFEEGRTGFGAEPRDADSLFAALERLLATPVAERRAMGLRGREKVAAEFSRAEVVASYLAAIDEVAAKR